MEGVERNQDGVKEWMGMHLKPKTGEGATIFVMQPTALVHDLEISNGAKTLYSVFAEIIHESDKGKGDLTKSRIVYSSPIADILRIMGITRRSYNRLSRELREAGYLYSYSMDHPHMKRRKLTCYVLGAERGTAERVHRNSGMFVG